jgi:hypothetical protein
MDPVTTAVMTLMENPKVQNFVLAFLAMSAEEIARDVKPHLDVIIKASKRGILGTGNPIDFEAVVNAHPLARQLGERVFEIAMQDPSMLEKFGL